MALSDYGPYAASTSFGKLLDRIQQQTHVYRSAAGSLCIQQKSEEHFEPLLNQAWQKKHLEVHPLKFFFQLYTMFFFIYDFPIVLCGIPMDFPIFSSPKIRKTLPVGLGQAPLAAHLLIKAFLAGVVCVLK